MIATRTHVYIPDGIPDHRGDDRCAHCQRPRRNPAHDLPQTSPEQAALDARRTGEER